MKVNSDFRNELLKRKEVLAEIEAGKNPGFLMSQKEIANHFKVSEELVVMKALRGNFGSSSFLIDAFIYDSAEDRDKIEPKKKVKAKGATASK